MVLEIQLQSQFFIQGTTIDSIYFGGGTPSVLDDTEISLLIGTIYKTFKISDHVEISFEANPDDLSSAYLETLKSSGVNRLSIGTQSLNNDILKWMNRSHDVVQARKSVEEAEKTGFKDISIDLIYGIPQLDNQEWINTVNEILGWPINHLSAYSLTLEPQTPYARLVKQKKYQKPSDKKSVDHFKALKTAISARDWEHYEISNYCKATNYSKHNTAYWFRQAYLGIGPSAHSFDGSKRFWNIRSNKDYLAALNQNKIPNEFEVLDNKDKINEHILTGLRTKWGVDLSLLKEEFNFVPNDEQKKQLEVFNSKSLINITSDKWILTDEGQLFSDHISSELFI